MIETGTEPGSADLPQDQQRRVVRKIALRVLPLVFVGYIFSYFDRTNIGFAALTMNDDLGISAYTYGWIAGIFFLGYIAFGIPSTLALNRFSARFWLSALMIAFGVISTATAFVDSVPQLAIMRFLLGAAEAGVFPGILVYITMWFPPRYRGRVMTAFIIAVPFSAMIGGPLAGLILRMNETLGVEGWRWLFFVEGLPAFLIGLLGLRLIPSRPAEARWLSDHERRWLNEQLTPPEQPVTAATGKTRSWTAILDGRVIVLALAQTCSVMAFYGVTLWLPQLLKQISSSTDTIAMLSAIPYAAAIPAMILLGRSSDRTQKRAVHVGLAYGLITVGLLLAIVAGSSAWALVGLSVVAIGNLGGQSSLFSLPGTLFTPAKATAAIAVISSVSNIGGFAGPYAIGALKNASGGYTLPFIVLAVLAAAGATAVWVLGRRWEYESRTEPAGRVRPSNPRGSASTG
ncbi:MFS transporter [Nocardia sp. NPDC050799]|uniref:MFS transporter n=1 Tax=Nocardia sp. NPDC050799 TaxID=3154842 RepID=UPI0033E8DD97